MKFVDFERLQWIFIDFQGSEMKFVEFEEFGGMFFKAARCSFGYL